VQWVEWSNSPRELLGAGWAATVIAPPMQAANSHRGLRMFIRHPLDIVTAETIHALALGTAHYFRSATDGLDFGQVNREQSDRSAH
jgi:hypothetical protein